MRRPSLIERFIAILLLGSLYFFIVRTCVYGAEIPSPLAEVKDTVESIRQTVKDPNLSGEAKKEKRHTRIRELMLERLDFEEMARRALGANWKGRTDSEKTEYTAVFCKFMEVFYRKRVFTAAEFINSIDIKYGKERIDGNFAEVEIKIVYAPEDIVVLLKLHLIEGHWKAYDVLIENVSAMLNWRSQFARIIQKSSFAALLQILKDKIIELDN